jgi:hypothetical protein
MLPRVGRCFGSCRHSAHAGIAPQEWQLLALNTASVAAEDGEMGQADYSASKAGVVPGIHRGGSYIRLSAGGSRIRTVGPPQEGTGSPVALIGIVSRS